MTRHTSPNRRERIVESSRRALFFAPSATRSWLLSLGRHCSDWYPLQGCPRASVQLKTEQHLRSRPARRWSPVVIFQAGRSGGFLLLARHAPHSRDLRTYTYVSSNPLLLLDESWPTRGTRH